MTNPSPADGEPGCPDSVAPPAADSATRSSQSPAPSAPSASAPLQARRVPFRDIAASTWDALVDVTPAATPFSRHCVQRAWWNAYGATAHDQTLVVTDPAAPDRIVAIAPLMHRHALEPSDVAAKTALRHERPPVTAVRDTATAVFFGASYHADYSTILSPADVLPAVAEAVVAALADPSAAAWDVVDLRRLRSGDPAADALAGAFERRSEGDGWHVLREREDVCPVLTVREHGDFEAYLCTLGKKDRHEIRRKIRRAESSGEVALRRSRHPLDDLEAFVDLHQKRWGAEGLFPDTDGGAASRRFFSELFEDCSDFVELSFLTVGGQRIAAGVTFEDSGSIYYYNAGVDPEARDLSPGVLMVACYIQRAIEEGRRRLDFLRGDEGYKYTWGATDEPIDRLLVERLEGEDRLERGNGR